MGTSVTNAHREAVECAELRIRRNGRTILSCWNIATLANPTESTTFKNASSILRTAQTGAWDRLAAGQTLDYD
jgi:hypothetical protein